MPDLLTRIQAALADRYRVERAPYFSFLLERTPKAQPAEPRSWRKDEYPE